MPSQQEVVASGPPTAAEHDFLRESVRGWCEAFPGCSARHRARGERRKALSPRVKEPTCYGPTARPEHEACLGRTETKSKREQAYRSGETAGSDSPVTNRLSFRGELRRR